LRGRTDLGSPWMRRLRDRRLVDPARDCRVDVEMGLGGDSLVVNGIKWRGAVFDCSRITSAMADISCG